MKLIRNAYWVIEKGANVFGFFTGVVSIIVWIWALVYPGQAISVLESYQARFTAVEESVARIEDNTETLIEETDRIGDNTDLLVAALPRGVRLTEVYHVQDCPNARGNPAKASLSLENADATPVAQATLVALNADGTEMLREEGLFLNAEGFAQFDIPGTARPDRICLTTGEGDDLQAAEYSIVTWRKTIDNCAENPNFGFLWHEAGFVAVPPEDMTLCR